MATCCCQPLLQLSSCSLSGAASNSHREQCNLPSFVKGGGRKLNLPGSLVGAVSRSFFGECLSESSWSARNLTVRSAVGNDGSPTTSGSVWEPVDAQGALDEAEDLDLLAASDPASSWEENESNVLEAALNDETNPAHWLREWAENQEQNMHAAAEVAYSVLSERNMLSEGSCCTGTNHSMSTTLVMGLGLALSIGIAGLGAAGPAEAAEVGSVSGPAVGALSGLFAQEPANALSLPTWVIHVASVVEW